MGFEKIKDNGILYMLEYKCYFIYILKMMINLKKKFNFYVCFSNNIGNLMLLKFYCNKNLKIIGLIIDKSVID